MTRHRFGGSGLRRAATVALLATIAAPFALGTTGASATPGNDVAVAVNAAGAISRRSRPT